MLVSDSAAASSSASDVATLCLMLDQLFCYHPGWAGSDMDDPFNSHCAGWLIGWSHASDEVLLHV